jgi:hypothetical protein
VRETEAETIAFVVGRTRGVQLYPEHLSSSLSSGADHIHSCVNVKLSELRETSCIKAGCFCTPSQQSVS